MAGVFVNLIRAHEDSAISSEELLDYAARLAAKLAGKPETCEVDEVKKLLSSFSGLNDRLC